MIIQEKYKLFNGTEIPKIGLGTWFINDKDVVHAVRDAVNIGYRHIDTAQAYQNESGVGKGVMNSNVNRNEIFVTTKLAAEVKTFDKAVASIDDSLNALGLEYIDLMIIHSPQPWKDFRGGNYHEGNSEAWKALEEAYKAGKLKAIGVSNFKQADLENIFKTATVKPMVNQVLAHIGNTPFELIAFCQQHNILVEAYSPIGHGELLKNENVKAIADEYDVSVAQLGIRYCLQLGMLPLPKTGNVERMKINAAVDFEISETDMQQLKNLEPIQDYGDASKFPVYAKK